MDEKVWLRRYDPGVPDHIAYPDQSVHQFLTNSAQRFGSRVCAYYHDQAFTYQQIDWLSTQLAKALLSMGLKKGEPVGILLPNSPQFVISFYGILKAGGVVVAMNPAYQHRELSFQVSDSGVRVLVCTEDSLPLIHSIFPASGLSQLMVTSDAQLDDLLKLATGQPVEPCARESVGCEQSLVKLINQAKESQVSLPAVEPDDVAIFQYSGGTTGIPKAAEGTHRNLTANTLQFQSWLPGLNAGKEVVLAAIPLFHVYGMVIALSMGIALGASIVLEPNPRNIQSILEQVQRHQVTLLPGVPNLYNAINHHEWVRQGQVRLNSIKACISGSATLMKETKQTFEELTGGKLMEGYGLSEAPTATHCNPMLGENRTGSIGLPLPDVDAEIVSLEDGKTRLPANTPGELIVRGPQVMRGYHNMLSETKKTLIDDWLYTGDVAYMDEDGFFYLVDRKKDVIKVGGLQVWPKEVEQVISEHPNVAEVGVAGVVRPEIGERVKAWVVKKRDVCLTAEEVKTWCATFLARYKVPDTVVFIDALPKSTVGKVLRRELVRLDDEEEKKTPR